VVEVDIRRGIEGERCTDITAYSGEKRERESTPEVANVEG